MEVKTITKHHCRIWNGSLSPWLRGTAPWFRKAVVCEVENDSAHLCLCHRLRKDRDFLSISNVNEGDKGTYTCTVKSEIDEDSASARLTVLGTLRSAFPFQMQIFFCAIRLKKKKRMFTKTDLVLQSWFSSMHALLVKPPGSFFTFEPLLITLKKKLKQSIHSNSLFTSPTLIHDCWKSGLMLILVLTASLLLFNPELTLVSPLRVSR